MADISNKDRQYLDLLAIIGERGVVGDIKGELVRVRFVVGDLYDLADENEDWLQEVSLKYLGEVIKGLILLEKHLQPGGGFGSGTPIPFFFRIWSKRAKGLPRSAEEDFLGWVLQNRNNAYIPYGTYKPPLEYTDESGTTIRIKTAADARRFAELDMEQRQQSIAANMAQMKRVSVEIARRNLEKKTRFLAEHKQEIEASRRDREKLLKKLDISNPAQRAAIIASSKSSIGAYPDRFAEGITQETLDSMSQETRMVFLKLLRGAKRFVARNKWRRLFESLDRR